MRLGKSPPQKASSLPQALLVSPDKLRRPSAAPVAVISSRFHKLSPLRQFFPAVEGGFLKMFRIGLARETRLASHSVFHLNRFEAVLSSIASPTSKSFVSSPRPRHLDTASSWPRSHRVVRSGPRRAGTQWLRFASPCPVSSSALHPGEGSPSLRPLPSHMFLRTARVLGRRVLVRIMDGSSRLYAL